jgi:hypothetical protein
MSQSEANNYEQLLKIVSNWSEDKQFAFVHDVLKVLESRKERKREPTLQKALGLLATDQPPPTDEEVKQWLDEHRWEKYGK